MSFPNADSIRLCELISPEKTDYDLGEDRGWPATGKKCEIKRDENCSWLGEFHHEDNRRDYDAYSAWWRSIHLTTAQHCHGAMMIRLLGVSMNCVVK